MNPSFSITTEWLEGLVALGVAGELDQATAPEFREALDAAEARGGPVLVDLGRCEFIDSTGLSLLVEAQRRLGEQFAVCSARPEVSKLLELTGIDDAVTLFAVRQEAIDSLAEAASRD